MLSWSGSTGPAARPAREPRRVDFLVLGGLSPRLVGEPMLGFLGHARSGAREAMGPQAFCLGLF